MTQKNEKKKGKKAELVANCDHPEEVIANCENPQETSLSQCDIEPWEVSDLFFYIEEFTDMNYTDAWTVIMTYGPILRELRDKYEREVLKIKK